MPPKTHDLAGCTFGRLSVVEWKGYIPSGKRKLSHWLCRCECGQEKTVGAHDLVSGKTESCGCRGREIARRLAMELGLRNAKNVGTIAARQLYSRYKNDAKRRGLEFTIPYSEAIEMYGKECAYCGELPSRVNAVHNTFIIYNGIDRIDNSLGYVQGNCAPCCKKCNEVKRAMSISAFREYISKIYHHLIGAFDAVI